MQKLLIATSNAGKVAQYRKGLEELGLELVSLADMGFSPVKETGTTFEENALLKARVHFNQSGLPCIADDGGLEIDFLEGKPGVTSRRWKTGDEQVTDEELVEFTIEQMHGVPIEKRTARFSMAMTFVDVDGKEHVAHASTEGYVPLQASKTILPHLPFDSVLFIPQFGKTRSELIQQEYESISQRFLALKKLKSIIAEAFGSSKK